MAIASNPPAPVEAPSPSRKTAYGAWIESVGVPIHRGYYVEDVRTVEVAPWPGRNCSGAFLVLAGQEGVSEARVTEIPPGQSTTPLRFTIDEAVYVADGRGLTTVWAEGKEKKTFEWQKHSMFVIPRGYTHQLSNTQGNHPARLLHYNYLPLSMEITPDPQFFFDNPYVDMNLLYGNTQEFYSEAKSITPTGPGAGSLAGRIFWYGSFFPDMRVWDKLHTYQERGAGGHRVWVEFAKTGMTAHMSVFPSRTYKKGHRHGPGVVIIIPAGEGYSIMWPEGRDKVVIPWHEASVFVPPNRWFHQHFNVGGMPARYLAFHTPRAMPRSETVEDLARDQIEYVQEDPSIRERFESELGKRDLTSLMPDQAYKDPTYKWTYEEEE